MPNVNKLSVRGGSGIVTILKDELEMCGLLAEDGPQIPTFNYSCRWNALASGGFLCWMNRVSTIRGTLTKRPRPVFRSVLVAGIEYSGIRSSAVLSQQADHRD